MPAFYQFDKLGNIMWSKLTFSIGENPGEPEFLGPRKNGKFFVMSRTTGISLWVLTTSSGNNNIQVVNNNFYTPPANTEIRGVTSNHHHLLITTRNTSSSKDQVRAIRLQDGVQMWTNGVGNLENYGACWDGKYFYSLRTRSLSQLRQFWIRDGVAKPAKITGFGLIGPRSVTFDGKSFWIVGANSTSLQQYDRSLQLIHQKTPIVPNTGWDGITTDGKYLYVTLF